MSGNRIGAGGPFLVSPAVPDAPPPALIVRAPLYTPAIARRQVGESGVSVNLLLTVLAITAVAPFSQDDWSTPSSRRSQQQDVAQNLLVTTLATAPAAVPFSQDDWQNPARKAAPQFDQPQNLLGTTLAPAQAAPFSQNDWSNPTRRVAPLADIPPNLLLTPGLAPPFRPVERGIPRAVTRTFQADPPNLLTGALSTPAVTAPFVQGEWPNPAARKTQRFDDPQNLLGTTLGTAPSVLPFSVDDWSIPRLPGRLDSWLAPNLQTGTLAPAITVAPFAQLNWPNFARAPARAEIVLGSNLALLTMPVAVPFRQTEWLNSRGKVAQIEIPSNRLVLTTPIVPSPFVAVDWRAPKKTYQYIFDAQRQMSPALAGGPVPGVFPPESPVHFHIGLRTRRLGDPDEAPATERLGTDIAPDPHRLGDATEAASTERLGEANETPDAEHLGSDSEKPPGRGLGS